MTDANAPALELRRARKEHQSGAGHVVALEGADLTVHRGEFVALMGPSGSGKSTLLSLAGGLDKPTSGQVLINGTSIVDASYDKRALVRRSSVGYVFQEYNLMPTLTALENVSLPAELNGTSVVRARRAARAALSAVGLDDLVDRFPDEMSGGQRQRVAIARATAGASTSLLLADEPTGALDSRTAEEIVKLLSLAARGKIAVVVATHDEAVAARADRVIHLHDGAVVKDTAETMFERAL